ncbi:MAG: DNA polymerase I, partial [Clostridia bacterium]|nr:DNA polymerase I [Clostridia bacterium]
MKDKLVIIDGNSLVFRAYYGLPSLLGKQGEPCNAIFGFCKMLINVIQKINPKYIIIAFDAGKHTFRHNLF